MHQAVGRGDGRESGKLWCHESMIKVVLMMPEGRTVTQTLTLLCAVFRWTLTQDLSSEVSGSHPQLQQNRPLWPILPVAPIEHQRQHMATASWFSFLKLSFNPGSAGDESRCQALWYSSEHQHFSPKQVWMYQFRGWMQSRAKQAQAWDTGWCWGNQNCQHTEQSEESQAPAAKPDQSPAAICMLPAKEIDRGDTSGGRGLG